MSTAAAEDLVAAELVAAPREGRSLSRLPGVIPASMAVAYQIQELAMSRWQDSVVGWKIGYIPADRRTAGDPDRLVGPIWRQQYHRSEAHLSAVEVGIFTSGFAAVEAELAHSLPQAHRPMPATSSCPRSRPTSSARSRSQGWRRPPTGLGLDPGRTLPPSPIGDSNNYHPAHPR